MEIIKLCRSNGDYIDCFTQWDSDQWVFFYWDETVTLYADFCTVSSTDSLRVEAENVSTGFYKARVPNVLFTQHDTINVFIADEDKTLLYSHIPVREKPMPDDFILDDDRQYISLIALSAEMNDMMDTFSMAESTRNSREEVRVSNENKRKDAEDERIAAENIRKTKENERLTSEENRVLAENQRIAAEKNRVSAETNRASAETGRSSAENARVTAERERVVAENERNAAESERQQTMQDILDAETGALQSINEAGSTHLSAINSAGTTQKNAVETAGAVQVAAVQDKGATTLASIPEDYTTLNNQVEQLSAEIAHHAPGIICTASGRTIHTTDSADKPLPMLEIYGESTQETTTGKNLLPYPYVDATQYKNGITFTDNGDGSVKVNGYATATATMTLVENMPVPNSKITFSGCPTGGGYNNYWIMINYTYGENSYATTEVGSGKTIDFTDKENPNVSMYIYVYKGKTVSNLIYMPQIEISDGKTPYEPYTGGAPSPSPTYPQEIESVGDDGSIEVVSAGKNLIDSYNPYFSANVTLVNNIFTDITSDTEAYLGYKVQQYKDRSTNSPVSTHAKSITQKGVVEIEFTKAKDVNYIRIANIGKATEFSLYYTVSDIPVGSNLVFSVNVLDTTIGASKFTEPMLRLASVEDSTYEPYRSNTTTITLPSPLRGIPVSSGGNVTIDGQQYISDVLRVYSDGSGEIERFVKKITLNGTESWYRNADPEGTSERFALVLEHLSNGDNAYCTHVPYNKNAISTEEFECCFVGNSYVNFYRPRLTGLIESFDTTLWKNWLNEKKPIFNYGLKTPTTEQLTPSQVSGFLQTYYSVTNIWNSEDAYMNVEYVADTKIYVDNKIAEVAAALVANV